MKKILLVEDNELQRQLYRDELGEAGYAVDIAPDGDNALAKVETQRPDLIVLDIELPNRDGIETMRKLLDDHPDLPIIVNSAYAHYKSNFISWGAQAYVVRDGVEIYRGRVSSLRRFKDDAREVESGFECGVGIENFNDIKVGDVIEVIEIKKITKTLEGTRSETRSEARRGARNTEKKN